MLNEQAPSLPKSTAPAILAVAPAKATAPKAAPLPPPAKPAPAVKEPDAKPPVAPPDPVYTSFTAPAAEPVAPAPVEPVAAPAPENKPTPVEVAQNPQPTTKPTAPKPEPAATKLETSPTGSHILQVGVFADMSNARKQQSKLAASGISAHTSTKLRIGPFSSIEEAEAARDKVRAAGINITLADDIESSSRGQSLLAGQYTDMDQAKRLQASLGEHGLPAHTETRLLVGPFANKAKADAARNKIKKLNISVVLMPNN
jgi:DedD protein